MFSLIFILVFIALGLRIAQHYPTRLKLAYDEYALSKGQYYRLFTPIFDNQNWIGVLFAALNIFFLIATLEKEIGWIFTLLTIVLLSTIPYFINFRTNTNPEHFWGSLPLIFGLFVLHTCINPYSEIRLFFILPLNYIIVSTLIIGFLLYNEIKHKVVLSSISFAAAGIVGVVLASLFAIQSVLSTWYYATLILISMLVLVALNKNWITKRKPQAKVIKMNPDHYYNIKKVSDQERVNQLLDKIKKNGIQSLTREEKKFLEEYSKK